MSDFVTHAPSSDGRAGRTPVTLDSVARLDFAKMGGLLPAIVQHAESGSVLMLGYMSLDALRATLERRRVVFFSRSKQRLWEKGESSGHALDLVAIETDCDADALLVSARPRGPVCHLGTASCFGDEPSSPAARLAFLAVLERVIAQRVSERPEGSYTARLTAQGVLRVAQKVGEEGLELALAGAAQTNEKVTGEAADLLYHLLVLLQVRQIPLERVIRELEDRHQAKP